MGKVDILYGLGHRVQQAGLALGGELIEIEMTSPICEVLRCKEHMLERTGLTSPTICLHIPIQIKHSEIRIRCKLRDLVQPAVKDADVDVQIAKDR